MAAGDYYVRDLINDALLEIGRIGVADPEDPDVYALAVRRTIAMYDRFQADRLLLYTKQDLPFTLVANQQAYTIAPSGANWVGARPLWIAQPRVIPVGDVYEIPLHLYTRTEWEREQLKTMTDLYPRAVLYEPTSTTQGTFRFWPIPTTGAAFLVSSPQALQTPTDLNTVLLFAPGYKEAWIYNLAKRLCRPFKIKLTQDLFEDARDSLGAIKRLNDEEPPAPRGDWSGNGGYDVRSNTVRIA